MKHLKAIRDKLASMTREQKDFILIGVFAVVAIIFNALRLPDSYLLPVFLVGAVLIVLNCPKIDEAEDKQESTLDKALKETHRQLNPVKGVEALDEHFKKHPYKMPRRIKSRGKRK